MEYRYLTLYALRGLTAPDAEIQISVEDPSATVEFLRKDDADRACSELDLSRALLYLGLTTFTGAPQATTPDELLQNRLAEIRMTRKKQIGTSALVLIAITGEVDISGIDKVVHRDDYSVGLDLFDKTLIRRRHKPIIDSILMAVCLNPNAHVEPRKLADALFLVQKSRKPLFSFTFDVGRAHLTVAKKFDDEFLPFVRKAVPTLLRYSKLVRVYSLLLQSYNTQLDPLRRFITAWTALEVLTNKLFKAHKSTFDERLRRSAPTAPHQAIVNRMLSVMEGRYSTSDRFTVVAEVLSPDTAEGDISAFEDAMGVRHDLVHGQEVDENSLPVETVQGLIRRYLAAHVGLA
jgi:hypothetical protein